MIYYVLVFYENLDSTFGTSIYEYPTEMEARVAMYDRLSSLISSNEYLGATVQVTQADGRIVYETSWNMNMQGEH